MPLKVVARQLIPIALCAAFVAEGLFAGSFFPGGESVDSRSSLDILADHHPFSPELMKAVERVVTPAADVNSPLASLQRQLANVEPLSVYGKAMVSQTTGENPKRFEVAPASVKKASSSSDAKPASLENEKNDEDALPLRWDAVSQSLELADSSDDLWEARLTALLNDIPLERNENRSLRQRAAQYSQAVSIWSRHFKLKPDLVFALIHTESNFNPRLVSGRSAHGLMQVVPDTAGEEVKRWLGESGIPSTDELFDPYTNIKYGAGYFRLLLQRYFSFVKDPVSREYCAIAAYNSGCSPILRIFGQSRDEIDSTINSLSSDEVLNQLLDRLPMNQTRTYLRKVLSARQYFASVPGTSAGRRTTAELSSTIYVD